MQDSSPVTLISIALPIVLMLLGVGLMKAGFWPRRRGSTPHCGGCGYPLVGNESGTCPECGRAWFNATVIRGERRRHKGIGISGLVVFLLGLAIGGGLWLTDIDWYRHLPESWIVSDAGSSNPTVAKHAWDELLRRRAIAPLSDSVENKLTEIALREQASASPGPMLPPMLVPMLEFVAQRFLDKKLTDQQADQFFLNTVNPTLHTRAMVAAGDVIPIQIRYRGRGPTTGWSYRLGTKSVRVGTQNVQIGGSMGGSGLGGAGSSTSYVNGQPPGEYPVEAHTRVEIFHAPLGSPTPPVWSKDIALKTTLKVVPQSPSEMVKLTDKPELAQQIKKSLRIDKFKKRPDGTYEMSVDIQTPPMDVAFSVFARAGEKEIRVGEIATDAKTTLGTSMNPSNIGDIPVGKVSVIFRSDPSVARKTIDLVEIWKGEILLEDVELTEAGK
jgi:hypothetical protein